MTGVSRVSVRTALKSLIAQGFLVSKQGEGTFVVDVSVDMNMDILVPIIGLDKTYILEVLEFRKILEVGIVPLIFENLTDDDLIYLERNVQKLEQTAEEQIGLITELDLDFHRMLCLISGNSLIIKVNRILADLFQKIDGRRGGCAGQPDRQEISPADIRSHTRGRSAEDNRAGPGAYPEHHREYREAEI